jgi:hypothetical protein
MPQRDDRFLTVKNNREKIEALTTSLGMDLPCGIPSRVEKMLGFLRFRVLLP